MNCNTTLEPSPSSPHTHTHTHTHHPVSPACSVWCVPSCYVRYCVDGRVESFTTHPHWNTWLEYDQKIVCQNWELMCGQEQVTGTYCIHLLLCEKCVVKQIDLHTHLQTHTPSLQTHTNTHITIKSPLQTQTNSYMLLHNGICIETCTHLPTSLPLSHPHLPTSSAWSDLLLW